MEASIDGIHRRRIWRDAVGQGGIAGRKAMINRTHTLPLVRQCHLLELARSTAYYQPRPMSEGELTTDDR